MLTSRMSDNLLRERKKLLTNKQLFFVSAVIQEKHMAVKELCSHYINLISRLSRAGQLPADRKLSVHCVDRKSLWQLKVLIRN